LPLNAVSAPAGFRILPLNKIAIPEQAEMHFGRGFVAGMGVRTHHQTVLLLMNGESGGVRHLVFEHERAIRIGFGIGVGGWVLYGLRRFGGIAADNGDLAFGSGPAPLPPIPAKGLTPLTAREGTVVFVNPLLTWVQEPPLSPGE
jgi:hypothetical protein